jgi:hypothetical protein
MTLTEMASRFLTLREEKSAKDAEAKALKDELDGLEQEIFSGIIAEGFDRIVVDGYTFAPTVKPLISVSSSQKAAAFAWLEANGYEAFVIRELNKKDFNPWARERIAESFGEIPDWMKEHFTVYEKQEVSVRKATGGATKRKMEA